jgi:hypothetical protein
MDHEGGVTETSTGDRIVSEKFDKSSKVEVIEEDWPTEVKSSTPARDNGGWNSSKVYSGFSFAKDCHKVYSPDKHSPLFTISKSKIYPGRLSELSDSGSWNLVIDCANGQYRSGGYYAPMEYQDLEKYVIPVITLPWEDMSPPPVQPEFWINLVKRLPPGNIGVGCVGGHGRTGTAIAAMLICSTSKNATQAIRWVRREYCESAIENDAQEKYLFVLEKKLGRK